MELSFDWPDWLQDPAPRAAVTIVVALLLAAFVDLVFRRVVSRLTQRTRTDVDDRIAAMLRGPIAATVVIIGAWIAIVLVAPSGWIVDVSRSLLVTVAVFHWFLVLWRLSRLVLEVLAGLVANRETGLFQPRTQPAFEVTAKAVLLGGGSYFLLLAWGVDVTGWLASAGIVGIAVGFAAKDTLANLFAGVFILADAPYKPGDYLVLDSGERGRVVEIGLRSTRLQTRDEIEIIIPNSVMANARIKNESGGPYERERLRVAVGVAYGSDIDHVREVLLDVAATTGEIIRDDDDVCPRVRLRAFGASSLDFELLVWIAKPELRGRVLDQLNTAVYKRFGADGIEIPYAKRDVYIRGLPEGFALPGRPLDGD